MRITLRAVAPMCRLPLARIAAPWCTSRHPWRTYAEHKEAVAARGGGGSWRSSMSTEQQKDRVSRSENCRCPERSPRSHSGPIVLPLRAATRGVSSTS
jgi:hypothetical protein